MTTPLLTTKLYIPPVRPELVPRPRLIEQLDAGLHRKLDVRNRTEAVTRARELRLVNGIYT